MVIAWFLHRAFLCTVTTAEHYPIDRRGALTSLPNFQLKKAIKRKSRWFADNADGADEDGFNLFIRSNPPDLCHPRTSILYTSCVIRAKQIIAYE